MAINWNIAYLLLGYYFPPLVNKILMIEREKNNVWPNAHLEGIHCYQNISFHKLLEHSKTKRKNSLKNFFCNCGKFYLMSELKHLSSYRKLLVKYGQVYCIIFSLILFVSLNKGSIVAIRSTLSLAKYV